MAYTTAQLTGHYLKTDGTPAEGTIEIIPNSSHLVDAEGDVILAGRVKVTLDGTGSFTVTLPATDDVTIEPATGRQYTVVAKLRHTHLAAITGVELPGGTTVDVADVASLPVVDPAVTLAATPAQLAALEASFTAEIAGKQDAGDYATTTDLAAKADVTALDAKADVADIPTTPGDVGAEPAGLSETTNDALAATYANLAPQGKRAMPRPSYTMVTTFQSGHGWTNSGGGATFNLNDTTDYTLGAQSAKGTSIGTAANNYFRRMGGAAFNTTGKEGAVWVKVDDPTHLATIQLVAGNTTFTNTYTIPLYDASYGSAGVQLLKAGEWQEIRFSFGDAATSGSPTRSNITDWQIAFKDNNTGNPVTVHVNGLALYPDGTNHFANGVVSITFDDVYESHYTQARKKMDQYGYGATNYLIMDRVGASGGCTLAQLKDLEQNHGWENAAHAYTTASHTSNFPALATAGTLDQELRLMKGWLLANGLKGADHVAYPGGGYNAATEAIVRKYFVTGRTTFSLPTQVVKGANPYRLRVLNVTNATTTASITAAIDKAYANGTWLILVLHDIVTTPTVQTQFSIANFGTVIDYLNTKGIPVRTVGEVFNAVNT